MLHRNEESKDLANNIINFLYKCARSIIHTNISAPQFLLHVIEKADLQFLHYTLQFCLISTPTANNLHFLN